MECAYNKGKYHLCPNVKYHLDCTGLHGTKVRSVALPEDFIDLKSQKSVKKWKEWIGIIWRH